MHPQTTTRYTLYLDIPERDAALGEARANALLRSEFALALNASYLSALSDGDIVVDVQARERLQERIARYTVLLELDESMPELTDQQTSELLRRELQRALNASHFIRIADDDLQVVLVAREHADRRFALRAA
ncbi:MAG: hypothetical protein Q8O56_09790 [Solirubrobacteraceae bacterium]|nr:hypothetical protein [Solirubrobacteraceae bacterium]